MCGVFGIYTKLAPDQFNVPHAIYLGLQALQHRGQEAAGIATAELNGTIHAHRQQGLVNTIFNPTVLANLKGNVGVGHTRYSTAGNEKYLQPTIEKGNQDVSDMAFAHNGNLVNTNDLKWWFDDTEASDSWLLGKLIAQKGREHGYPLGIERALVNVEGAYSVVHASKGCLLAARDTCALDIVGAKYLRDVKPGELIKITARGIDSYTMNLSIQQHKKCIFEDVYFSRPDSRYARGETIYTTRKRMGMFLSAEDTTPKSQIDLIVGVPDSGLPAAIGYSYASEIPYGEAFIKNRYVGRTFIQPIQELRESDLHVKLNVLTDVVMGKRLIVIDDSIVRGTTTRKLVKMLREAGAKEIHFRITAPPVKFPCYFGVDTPNQKKLIAHNMSVEETRQHIGADSLRYISLDSMKKATGRRGFCDACFTGDYPI